MKHSGKVQAATFSVVIAAGAAVFLITTDPKPVGIDGTSSHTCAVLSGGAIECWGSNDYGKLGAGLPVGGISSTPARVVDVSDAKSVSARTFHTCSVANAGTVKCWGRNNHGQLGNGSLEDSNVPVQVQGIDNALAVAAGVFHSCALLDDETVKCWGYNGYSQLGDRTFENSTVPVLVQGLTGATSITSGGDHNCSVMRDKTIQCWGWNAQGQVGTGTDQENISEPTTVAGISDAVEVSAGDYHTCAIVETGEAFCWGLNGATPPSEELALLPTESAAQSPARPSRGSIPTQLTAERDESDVRLSWSPSGGGSVYHVYYAAEPGVTPDNYASLEGGGMAEVPRETSTTIQGASPDRPFHFVVTADYSGHRDGQLGDGTFLNSSVPVAVPGVETAKRIMAGYANSCVVLADDRLSCWGRNNSGQVGDGKTYAAAGAPVAASVVADVQEFAISGAPCVLDDNDDIRCWGPGAQGGLGNGSLEQTLTPVPIQRNGRL